MREYSYGIIPLKKENSLWQAFMIQHHAGHWGFPKGHPLPKEDPRDTAYRELQEETNLFVDRLLPLVPLREKYTFEKEDQGKKIEVQKFVLYFLAEVGGDVLLQEEEIQNGQWVAIDQIHTIVSFEEGKKLASQIVSLLS